MRITRFPQILPLSLALFATIAGWGCSDKGTNTGKPDANPSTTVVEPPDSKPTTYQGTWSGGTSNGLHVREISVSQNEFPCNGRVSLQYGTGQILHFHVTWEQKGNQIHGMYGEKKTEIARVKLAEGQLSGEVTSPIGIGNQPKETTFSAFARTGSGK